MPGGRVVVHDVDALESFMGTLQSKRDELECLFETLGTETVNQGDNWQDPQYEHLKDLVETYCSECTSQLDELDESINCIAGLITKLRDI